MNIGFIDYYLDNWHANSYPGWIRDASGGELRVAAAYASVDSPHAGGRSNGAWCEANGVERCDSIEALIDRSDALVVLAPDNAEMHEPLCRIALASGKPTYVDKTFAPDGAAARRIFAVADAAGTPCYTCSALRFAKEYQTINRASIRAVASWGPGALASYAIHQIEPLMMLFGAPAVRAQYVPAKDFYTLLLSFADGRQATVSGFLHGSPYSMNLCMDDGNRALELQSDFFKPFIMEMVQFFRTGQAHVPREDTLRAIDALGLAIRAKEAPGTWVEA